MIQFARQLFIIFIIIGINPVLADVNSIEIGVLKELQGIVSIQRKGGADYIPAKIDDKVFKDDAVRTKHNSKVTIIINGGESIKLIGSTTIIFSINEKVKFSSNEKSFFDKVLSFFRLKFFRLKRDFRSSKRARELSIETPFVNPMHEG